MVKHIILWKIKEEYSDIEKAGIKNAAQRSLSALIGKIDGLVDMKIITKPLQTANCDMMLDSTFSDFAALKAYAVNPLHVEVADTKIRPYIETRTCIDYEI